MYRSKMNQSHWLHESINDQFPVYSIFIYILVIMAGMTLNIFPCSVVNAIDDNIYVKHFIGYLTMTFSVVMLVPIKDKSLNKILIKSLLMYAIFISISKTEKDFFIPIIVLLGIIYLLILKKTEYQESIKTANDRDKKTITDKINGIVMINNSILLVIAVLIVFGFCVYLGRKKYEYGKRFNYMTFAFSNNACSKTASTIGFKKSLNHLFD